MKHIARLTRTPAPAQAGPTEGTTRILALITDMLASLANFFLSKEGTPTAF